jgi:hypothetical protein
VKVRTCMEPFDKTYVFTKRARSRIARIRHFATTCMCAANYDVQARVMCFTRQERRGRTHLQLDETPRRRSRWSVLSTAE